MATIFEKIPASGEKCLVLEPKESLFYPFDFGNWSEIRLGFVYSATSINEYNGLFTSNSVEIRGSATNNCFFGFTKSPNDNLPFSNDVLFLGATPNTGAVTTVTLSNNSPTSFLSIGIPSNARTALISGDQFRAGVGGLSNTLLRGDITAANCTGTTIFCSASQVRLIINTGSKDFSLHLTQNTLNGYPTADTSTRKLRTSMANESFLSPQTGFYTEDGTSSGNLLPFPDKVLFYFPFINARFRIHNFVVEKYA